MLSYCLKYTRNTESKNPKVVKAKNGRRVVLSKFTACGGKKLRVIKEQEAKGLLISLGIKTPSSQTSLIGPLLL